MRPDFLYTIYNKDSTAVHLYKYLKKNQTTPRPSEHPPVMGKKITEAQQPPEAFYTAPKPFD